MIETLSISGGFDKNGQLEPVSDVQIRRGEIVGVVGPTGSGKSSLIADIEQLAQGDTPTRRTVLVNGCTPSSEERTNPRKKIVAQLSQNMNFLANMTVDNFLRLHAKCRHTGKERTAEVLELANALTGEPIREDDELTILSGGQSRALMVADVAIISDSPIVLVDEIENAGIKKHDALKLLAGFGKIVLVVTHDPVLALMAERRIIMRCGGMAKIVQTTKGERLVSQNLKRIDEWMLTLRELVRQGELIEDVPHTVSTLVESIA
ncbi:MAG: ABC transporter ATP-binding protein [Spirochaetia bacterium]|jgi:ABC-type lipoprotein export system ATPase subunit